jgi:signal transduction histidine kinase
MAVVSDGGATTSSTPARSRAPSRLLVLGALLACVLALAAVLSERSDWQPVSLVLALSALMVAAELASTWARKVRMSAGLMVQTTMMALLGPAPAALAGVVAMLIDWRVYRARTDGALLNMVIFGALGLFGGLVFEAARAGLGLERDDSGYAVLVLPVYVLLMFLNLALLAMTLQGLTPAGRRRLFRESGTPVIPLELLLAIMTATAVFTWAQVGLVAVVGLLAVLVITVPLARTVGGALQSDDDLHALRAVNDERAEEVARLSTDRERLLTEVVDAEKRERSRLAESLHDGPVQRLVAMRQDVAEGATADQLAGNLEAALAEARAIISAIHPVMARELGFESALRAAIAPFPAAASVQLTINSTLDDRVLAGTLLLPIAQELVVNAVKHASPSTIDLSVRAQDGRVVLEANDDGVGIDTWESGRKVQAGHLGLALVRRRVEDVGGLFDIKTRADGGTRSRVDLPLDLP